NSPVTIPSNRPTGTNYVWVIADVDSTANQSNENNDKEKTTFTVSPQEETLLEKYAPLLYMQEDERYHPTDVMNMLKNSRLWERREWKKDKLVDNTPTLQELVNNFDEKKYYLWLKYKEKELNKRNWKIDQTVYGRQFTTYDGGNKRTVLQYWFFYVYNDWDDDHEGDWEMIQIVFGSDNQPLLITYSIHKGGMTLPWDDPKVSKSGDHPKVYVSLGGHGSWNEPGNHTWYQSLTICDQCIDETSEQGDVIVPEGESISSNYTYKLVDLDKEEVNWIEWNGYWGKQGYSVGRKQATVYVPGPPSPPYVDYIEDDAFTGRWYDPVTWAVSPNPDGYFICASANSIIKAYDTEDKVRLIPTKHCDLITGECGYCPTTQAFYTGKDVVFDVYSRDGKEVDLRIGRYKRTGEAYEVEFKGLKIPKKGKASFTFSPEMNQRLEIGIDNERDGILDSYKLPDYLEIKEVDDK
ncbi:MAG: Vps62-related protein, partial [Planctomycetes bacterium]|nr:Vps62-related protein [Planctomycetota bacterium]